jgi:phage terminase large subunit GpA-like protein
MDALNDPLIEIIVMMLCSQIAKTEVLLNMLGYFTDQDPSPILFVRPTVDTMEAFYKERIETTFRATPILRAKLTDGKDGRGNSRKSAQTMRLVTFPGGYLAMAGANASSGLQSRPIRVVLCDEVDEFPVSAGGKGDPVKLAIQRTANFPNRKIVLNSTPDVDGTSKIQEWYNLGDKRQFMVPCPHCQHRQVMRWEQTCYADGEGARDFAHVYYRCAECHGRIEERHKPAMMAAGRWVAQVPGGKDGTGKIASFGDLEALCSPWVRWSEMAEQWCRATDARDRAGIKEFWNLRLGRPWKDVDNVLVPAELERLREDYPRDLPAGVQVVTLGVDVQGNRLEAEVVGWGAGKESWGLQYAILEGDPSQQAVWQQLDALRARTWLTEDGRLLGVACTTVDSGDGNRTSAIYAYCRAREGRGVWAVKGRGGAGVPIVVMRPSRPDGPEGAALYTVGTDEAKATLMDRLRLASPGPGYCHIPKGAARGYTQTWFEQLVSQKLIDVTRDGKTRPRWELPRGSRDEALDCRIYATAAMEIHGADLDGHASAYSWL